AKELPVDAAVCYYPGRIETDLGGAADLHLPLAFHFGALDQYIPPAAVDAVRHAFRNKPNATLHVYPDVGHGFYLPGRPSYNPEAACLSYPRTMKVLETLKTA
ncbi:MAG: dienelactone hydrolase family protein, partial [Planctomycetia bacterium]